jgi:hypothetical protein
MTVNKIIVSVNDKLTKREVLRRMWLRSVTGANPSSDYSLAYVARRIGKSIKATVQFVRYLTKVGQVNATIERHLVIFW